jgi:hypothetical protein
MSLLNEASFLVTPNGYKEDKLYAAIPTNGDGDMTVTRATTATRVNEAGLIELVPYNLLPRSEEFNNAAWAKIRSDYTANAIVSPNNTLSADKIIPNTDDATHRVDQIVTITDGSVYTYSIYAKADEYDGVALAIGQTEISSNYVTFNLTTGTFINTGTAVGNIEALPNGWYRCICTAQAGTTDRVVTGILNGGTGSYTGDGTSGIYIWGAQLVEGSSALTYQKTVDGKDIPRIDYTGGGCPSILLEPLRTNLLTYSEQFDNDPPWSKTNLTVAPNDTTAPDGTMTADSITTTPGSLSYVRQNTTQPAGTYTLSFFVKPQLGIGRIHLEIFTSNPGTHYFNLDLGVVVGSGDSTFTITPYPNGWYRCTATRTFASSILGTGAIYLATYGQSPTLTTIFFWGAQLEEGAYPTSYIPTTTIPIARNADVINRGNIRTNNLITDAGGTWFVDLINNVVMPRDTSNLGLFIADSSDGITGNVISIRNNSGLTPKRLTINKRIAGSQTQLYVTTADHVKVAIKWNGSKVKVFENGALVPDNLGNYETDFTTKDMEFFSGTGADVSKYIKQMALFPTPLDDDECKALTTL